MEKVIETPVNKDRVEAYEDGLKESSKLVFNSSMGTGAAAIILGHIRTLYKCEMIKVPLPEHSDETKVQRFERLVKEKTGLAKSTTSRYSQLAEVFLTKKHDIRRLIEDSVNGLEINDKFHATLVEKIGAGLEVTALYREYDILPETDDKQGNGKAKSLKDVLVNDLNTLMAKFGQKAMSEGFNPSVIVSVQDDFKALTLKSGKVIEAESIKAQQAKESRDRVVTKKKSKQQAEIDKAMELHAEEMKEAQPSHAQEAAGAAA